MVKKLQVKNMAQAALALLAVVLALVGGTGIASAQGRTVQDHDLIVEAGETLHGDVSVTNGDLVVYGAIQGKATVANGNAEVHGVVTGDLALLAGGKITLYPGSRVQGNVVATGDIVLQDGSSVEGSVTSFGGEVRHDKGAEVGGSIGTLDNPAQAFENLVNPKPHADPNMGWSHNVGPMGRIFGWLGLGILSALVLTLSVGAAALLPARVRTSSATLEAEAGPSVAVGVIVALLSFPVVGLAAMALAVTVVGLVLLPLLGLVVAGIFLFGFVVASHWLGRRLHASVRHTESGEAPFQSAQMVIAVEVLLGAAVILASTVLPAIFMPGWITGLLLGLIYVVSCLGIGAAVLSRFGTLQPRRRSYKRQIVYPTPAHSHYGSSLPHTPAPGHANTQPLGPAPILPREE